VLFWMWKERRPQRRHRVCDLVWRRPKLPVPLPHLPILSAESPCSGWPGRRVVAPVTYYRLERPLWWQARLFVPPRRSDRCTARDPGSFPQNEAGEPSGAN
jgi:hypothetical protein